MGRDDWAIRCLPGQSQQPWSRLTPPSASLPEAMMTPRDAYQDVFRQRRNGTDQGLQSRVAANSATPYPPGHPNAAFRQSFGDSNSPQIADPRTSILGSPVPGFEHETEGTEIIDGVYHVMCVKA
ncbi:hypothetical protein ACNKHO_25985 [Shigella flexneri]